MGYNLKNARDGKSIIIENTKMAKFGPLGLQSTVYTAV